MVIMVDRAFNKWHKARRHIDREHARLAWDAGRDAAISTGLRLVGYLHIMHMEGGQVRKSLEATTECPWGKRGVHFDEAFEVTCEPVFVRLK